MMSVPVMGSEPVAEDPWTPPPPLSSESSFGLYDAGLFALPSLWQPGSAESMTPSPSLSAPSEHWALPLLPLPFVPPAPLFPPFDSSSSFGL